MSKANPPTGILKVTSKAYDDPEGIQFNYPYFYFRKRQNFEGENEGWSFRPLGGMEYGYHQDYQCYTSWLIWALTTWGAVSHDKLEGLSLLAVSMYLNEQKSFRDTFVHVESEAESEAESGAESADRAESDSAGHAAGSRVARFFRETSHTEGV